MSALEADWSDKDAALSDKVADHAVVD